MILAGSRVRCWRGQDNAGRRANTAHNLVFSVMRFVVLDADANVTLIMGEVV
jgi:hypothetical protein